MAYEELVLEKKDGIATITLNNPAKLNAFTAKMRTSFLFAVDDITNDDEVRVVIVTGAGRAFTSGRDVARPGGETTDERPQRHFVQAGWIGKVFPQLDKPVIAAVNGPAAGTGFSLALSCDIRIASERASFVLAHIARGLAPDAGMTYYLPLLIGISRASELMCTAASITAAEAERLGIVHRVVPPDELMKVTRELATRIAQQAPIAVALTKKIVWRGMYARLNRQFDLETWDQQISGASEDFKEGRRAFFEKRPPHFTGR